MASKRQAGDDVSAVMHIRKLRTQQFFTRMERNLDDMFIREFGELPRVQIEADSTKRSKIEDESSMTGLYKCGGIL